MTLYIVEQNEPWYCPLTGGIRLAFMFHNYEEATRSRQGVSGAVSLTHIAHFTPSTVILRPSNRLVL